MLREIRALGFEYVELSHGTRLSLLPGILEAVAAGEIKVSSVHNFCPLPVGVDSPSPNLYEFSSRRERERELAHRYTLKTLDFAARVGAPVVVLHLGSIEARDYTGKLVDLLERGENRSPRYEQLRAEAAAKLQAGKTKFWERTREALHQLLPEAEKRGIRLGCENRQGLEELPLDADFPELFREFASPFLGYWHDTGHAQIKENLGFIQHAAQLASLRDRLLGLHIHDVQFPAQDHCPPGDGAINFAALKPALRPEHWKVFELSPGLPAEAVQRGVAHLKALWGEP